jgi:hypothetical protein
MSPWFTAVQIAIVRYWLALLDVSVNVLILGVVGWRAP